MTGAGTNTYLVGTDEVAVIDPGPDDAGHVASVVGALGRGWLRWVLLTHAHVDHAPGARRLARQTGAQILAFAAAGRGVAPDRMLDDGESVAGLGFVLEAIHTPGHASDHLCFFLKGERALFSGDLIMGGSTVVIAPPDGDMAAYLRSLERVRQWNPARIYPGHGDAIDSPLAVIEEYIRHRLMREQQVLDALRGGARWIPEIVLRIYADVPPAFHPMAALSVYAHLLKLRDEGKVSGGDRESEWNLI
ncbi:MAG: MBL fold metallo-hydrolase [Armatimonadota bacterium]